MKHQQRYAPERHCVCGHMPHIHVKWDRSHTGGCTACNCRQWDSGGWHGWENAGVV